MSLDITTYRKELRKLKNQCLGRRTSLNGNYVEKFLIKPIGFLQQINLAQGASMVLKFLLSLAGLSLLSVSFAQDVCVEEGRSIPVYPNAPKCCEGLSVRPPPKGLMGSAGTCYDPKACLEEGRTVGVYPGAKKCCEGLMLRKAPKGVLGSAGTCYDPKDPKDCVEAGKTVGVYPGAKKCCEGLMLKKAPNGMMGSAGTCYDPKACIGEGKSVVVHPRALKCCGGLELQPPEPGTFGSAGTCVSSRHPALPNVHDSRIQFKDPFRGSEKPSKPSKASQGDAQ